MKHVIGAIIIGAAADLPFGFFPKVSLLGIMSGAMVADFILAVIRVKLAGGKITNKGLTRSVIKFCQYGGAIAIGLLISYLSMEVSKYNSSWKYTPQFMSFMNNSLLVFIIHIEIRSCIKHLMNMDKRSAISTTLFGPVLKLLSVKIKGNPLVTAVVEAEDENDLPIEIEQTTIKSKNIVP